MGYRPHQRQWAEPSVGPWEQQVVRRLGNPPLRFNGRRLSHHWRAFSPEGQLEITLWERRQKGFVLGISRLQDKQLRPDAAQLKTLGDAADCLEALCQGQPQAQEAQDHLLTVISDLHQTLPFSQQFALLVGDVLSDWDAMPAVQTPATRQKEPSR